MPPGPGTWLDAQLPTFFPRWGAALGYTFAYVLTGLLIHRRLTPQLTPKMAAIFAVGVYFATVMLPYLGLLLVYGLQWGAFDVLIPGSIMNALSCKETGEVNLHVVFSLVWLTGVVILNLPWFVHQVREFKHEVPQLQPVQMPAPPVIRQPGA